MKMDLNYLKKLIKMLDTSELAEIEIEEEGTKIRLSKPRPKMVASLPVQAVQPAQAIPQQVLTEAEVSKNLIKMQENIETKNENISEIRSPMVGTYYSSPSPDAEAYVKTGDSIKAGAVICIIEAMKLMNEIECEISGKIVKILVENGHAVEYDQPLFLIEKV